MSLPHFRIHSPYPGIAERVPSERHERVVRELENAAFASIQEELTGTLELGKYTDRILARANEFNLKPETYIDMAFSSFTLAYIMHMTGLKPSGWLDGKDSFETLSETIKEIGHVFGEQTARFVVERISYACDEAIEARFPQRGRRK